MCVCWCLCVCLVVSVFCVCVSLFVCVCLMFVRVAVLMSMFVYACMCLCLCLCYCLCVCVPAYACSFVVLGRSTLSESAILVGLVSFSQDYGQLLMGFVGDSSRTRVGLRFAGENSRGFFCCGNLSPPGTWGGSPNLQKPNAWEQVILGGAHM